MVLASLGGKELVQHFSIVIADFSFRVVDRERSQTGMIENWLMPLKSLKNAFLHWTI